MALYILSENPHSEVAMSLIQELSAELGPKYGDDGRASFSPDDVIVERAAFVVAWLDNEPVGCGALRPMKDARAGEIKRMFVRKHVRGQGISRQILAKLEALAHEFEFERVILETGTLQIEAINLYESAGYQQIACYGQYVDNPLSVCYAKSLEMPND